MKNRTVALITIVLAPSLVLFGASPMAIAEEASPAVRAVRYEQRLGERIPLERTFTDEKGETLPLSHWIGRKPLVLAFAYYRCPNLCTLVLNGLVQSMREIPERLGKDYDVLTVSINPAENSSLALMKQRSYLARYGEPSANGWHFLVGGESAIQALTNAAGFHYERDRLSGEYQHPSGIIVLTPDGKISQYFFGIQFDPERLSQAIRKATSLKLGALVEEILLYCFHYEPTANKNGKAIITFVRVMGIMGVIAIFTLIIRLRKTPT